MIPRGTPFVNDLSKAQVCLECGATEDQPSPECWYCVRRARRTRRARPRLSVAPTTGERARGALSTIKGWMILIAFVAVATAVSRRAPISVCATIAVVPSLLVTGILAKQRRSQGMPMSDWEWAVSTFQITGAFMVMLFVVVEVAAYIVSLYWPH